MATALTPLPRDLLERVLLQLDARDVRTCTLVSKKFNATINSSIVLKYQMACHAAGVVDNPYCKLSCAERYEALSKREAAWRKLRPVFTKTFDDHGHGPMPSSICVLSSGVYLYANVNGQAIHYLNLPPTPSDGLRWTTIHSHGLRENLSGSITNIGTAICEHDLIVIAMLSEVDNPGSSATGSLDLVLLQFSTGEYHPLANCPRINVQEGLRPKITTLEISGDNLALIVNIYTDELYSGRFCIFDWKTGHKKLEHTVAPDAQAGLAFVSPEIIIVPNSVKNRYEVWEIPSESDDAPHQILNLRFPAVARGHSILWFLCHCRPNSWHRHAPLEPFFTSVDDAMIYTTIGICSNSCPVATMVTIFMRRRSLLDTITHLIQTDSQAYSTAAGGMPSVIWSEWGPPISRWFHPRERNLAWNCTSVGQRWTVLVPVGGDKSRIMMVDFSPYNIQDDLPGELIIRHEGEYFCHDGFFAEDIKMGLGCTIYAAPETYDFNVLFTDEQNLLCFKRGDEGTIEKMTVFHFG